MNWMFFIRKTKIFFLSVHFLQLSRIFLSTKMKKFNSNSKLSGKNVIESIQPLYLIGRIFGVVPYKIINNNLKFSFIGLIFSILFFSNLLCTLLRTVLQIRGEQRINQLVSIGDILIYSFTTWGFFISHIIFTKKYFSIYKKIFKIDNLFKSINIITQHKNDGKRILILLVLMLIYAFVMLVAITLIQCAIGSVLSWYLVFVHIWDEFCKVWFLVNSYTVANILKKRFNIINKKLEDYKVGKEIANSEKISKLRIFHDDLCDVCEIFNKIESVPCIFLLLLVFVVTITNSYYFYSYWYNYGDKIELGFVRMAFAVSHFLFYGLFLFPFFVSLAKEVTKF